MLLDNLTPLKSLRFLLLIGIIYSGCTSSPSKTITFQVVNLPANASDKIGLRGNQYPLSWQTTYFLEDNSATIVFPDSLETIEYKYVIDDGENITWEGIDNRVLQLMNGVRQVSTWNRDDPLDISAFDPIPAEKLMEEYKLIETMIRDVHPGTYRYADQAEIDAALEELSATITENAPMTLGQTYLAFSKVIATIQCDHSKPGFNNQSREVNALIHGQADKIPFTFRWIDNKMILILNASKNEKLIPGTEIIKINNASVSDIKASLFPYVAADGGTDLNRLRKLEVRGFDFRYNAFDVFFPLVFPLAENVFELEVKFPNGETASITVEGMYREDRARLLADRYDHFPLTRDDTWNLTIQNGTGILEINSFGLFGWKRMTIDYKQFLDSVFTVLETQSIDNLIIDIRNNTGGNDEIKNELFSYLPCQQNCQSKIKREGRTRYTTFPENLKTYCQTWGDNPWYYNLSPDDSLDGYYIFKEKAKSTANTSGKENAFNGDIYLLTSGSNTSLAYYTVRDFQWQKIGTIIGEETGGNLRDINGGQILFLRLPHSKIEIDFSIMGGFTEEDMPNSGVMPDIPVAWTQEDIIQNRDPQLEAALQKIKARN